MIDPSEPFTIIPAIDQAIDWAKTSDEHVARGGERLGIMAEYRTSYDAKLLCLKEGEVPAKFYVRPLTRKERRSVRSEPTRDDEFDTTFRLSVLRVEDARFRNGTRGAFVRHQSDAGKPIPESDMERFSEGVIQEVGQAVWARSFLDPFSDHVLPLPDISQLELTSLYLRRPLAGQTADTSSSATSSDAPKEPPAETRTP